MTMLNRIKHAKTSLEKHFWLKESTNSLRKNGSAFRPQSRSHPEEERDRRLSESIQDCLP
jgi:hypothetical protein